MNKIYLYEDYVHNNATLKKRLAEIVGQGNLISIDANDILHKNILKSPPPHLFIMPGGADLYYLEKLGLEGCKRIQDFVSSGGAYIGICAGAYFSCNAITWADDTPDLTIKGERYLKFHKGHATGPVKDFLLNNDLSQSCDNVVGIETIDGNKFKCLYRAGPVFGEGFGEVVLARYNTLPNKPAAIIQKTIGKGFCLLISPHLEFQSQDWASNTYKNNNKHYEHDASLVAQLKPFDQQIDDYWKSLIRKALSRSKIDA